MSDYTVETIEITPTIRVRIEYDQDPIVPSDWDNLGEIAYCSRHETLGTENVSQDRMDEISQGIRNGSLIGLPVFAYVHSGATIRCGGPNPFSCPWDSGQSGFVYTTREKALKEFGKKIVTKALKEKVIRLLQAEVKTYDTYLTGQVYGYIVELVEFDDDGYEISAEELDACWGIYGLEYAIEEGTAMAQYHVRKDVKELAERLACEERDIRTEIK